MELMDMTDLSRRGLLYITLHYIRKLFIVA